MAVVVVSGFVGYVFYEPGWGYEISGVDVSHHQGQIDWDALAADGTTFAYIKASEGGDWTDDLFSANCLQRWISSLEATARPDPASRSSESSSQLSSRRSRPTIECGL